MNYIAIRQDIYYHLKRRSLDKFGKRRKCNICGKKFRNFSASGQEWRPKASCPYCGVKERHRILFAYLKEEIKYKESNGKVLYFAPEKPLEKKLRESRDVITADLNSKEVDIRANIQNLPFDDSTFDLIICSHVLEHVKHDELAIKEIGRVLSETGDALIMIPKDKDMESTYEDFSITSEEDRKKEFGQENHVRKYGNDFEDIIQNEDLDVKTKTYSKKFSSDKIDKLGLKTYNSDGSFKKYPDIHHCTI